MNRRRILAYLVLAGGLAVYAYVHRFGLEHFALFGFAVSCAAISERTRDFLISMIPLIVFSYVYSFMAVFQPRSFDAVLVEPVYRLEQTLFGWMTPASGDLGPVDFFRDHHHFAADLVSGLLYTTHIPAIVLFAIYLWWLRTDSPSPGNRRRLHNFLWGFLGMSLVGLSIWALFPVAPPWYVEQFGLAPPGEPIVADPAGLGRLDAWLGIDYFSRIYSQATYVFGAFPSLHVAYPVWLALHVRDRLGRLFAWLFAAAMTISALYLLHHYVIDVLAGTALAFGVYALLYGTRMRDLPARLHAELFELLFGEPRDEQITRSRRAPGN